MASTISCLTATATAPSAPPSGSEPVSPMKTMAGGALYQRKPRPAPISAARNTASSPVPADVDELQILGEVHVADEIGDQDEGGRRDHHRHDGKAVEPVGEVHRIGRAGDDEAANQDEEQFRTEPEAT